jgi:choline dehydrogenase
MKKSEDFHNETVDTSQRGVDGLSYIQSVTSTNREFPLRSDALQSWAELGVEALPHLEGNGGNNRGVGELQENKMNGRREIAAQVYPLDGITVLTETLVEKVLLEKKPDGTILATGIQLSNRTKILGCEVIVSAGAIRTPQVLMLSGIGPADELAKFNIPLFLDQPNVGKNLADHGMFFHEWKVKDPAAGWALGSDNPLFLEEQYGWGTPSDFVVVSTVPTDGLAAAITEDEGTAPDPATHPLLSKDRSFIEHVLLYTGASDGSLVTFATITMLPTARGSVKLASADINDDPLIDPNYLGTAVDRYIVREGVKIQIKFAGSNETIIGQEILDGEAGAAGFDEVFTVDSTDEYIDARIRAGIG